MEFLAIELLKACPYGLHATYPMFEAGWVLKDVQGLLLDADCACCFSSAWKYQMTLGCAKAG